MTHPENEHATVRFSSVQQEIEPAQAVETSESMEHVQSFTGAEDRRRDDLSPEAQEELRNLAITLHKSKLQTRRMCDYNFEPVSLPISRVPSVSSLRTPQSEAPSPRGTPPTSTVHTPPLTPAASGSREHRPSSGYSKLPEPTVVTPQISPPHDPHQASTAPTQHEQRPSAAARARLPVSSNAANSRPKSMFEMGGAPSHPKDRPSETPGPSGDSSAPSTEGSPINSPRPGTPGAPGHTASGAHSPVNRPTSVDDNPYARSKRAAQERPLESLEAKFIFGSRGERPKSQYVPSSSSSSLAFSNGGNTKGPENKRISLFGGKDHEKGHGHHGSMSELKRFFKFGSHKKDKDKSKREKSPATTPALSNKSSGSGSRTPVSQRSSIAIPFADDHGLESKYGKFGKMLGSGAGGSVRLMKRGSDGVTFAVKQFRDRHSYESERDYNKKVTAEFCIGSTLHHGNIIETMDIVHEKGKWYEVMEYAPYDLFAIVMTGKMSREEVACASFQILSGLTYLHGMGLAHRDMKLDNVVVNEHGIMKIIDFGSAVVFRYPFEDEIVLASGIVGSDPYLAPEVYDVQKYDPQPTDIWSLAIIFCCMTLRRFPWKAPRVSDNSYKLFISEPSEEEKRTSSYPQKMAVSEPASRQQSGGTDHGSQHHHHHHRGTSQDAGATSDSTSRQNPVSDGPSTVASSSASITTIPPQQPAVIKGPWRLLRLLPRETRHIVGRMLELDPKKRATLDEIIDDPWVKRTPICMQEEGGTISKAEGHTHTLEPGGGGTSAPPSKR